MYIGSLFRLLIRGGETFSYFKVQGININMLHYSLCFCLNRYIAKLNSLKSHYNVI